MIEKHSIEISWASLWKVLLFVVLVAIFYEGRQVLLGLFLAIMYLVLRHLEKNKIFIHL